ncbi:MAG: 3-deoxy-manno-octulosonate cytidylyltransferase [bacterium]
MTNRIIAIIPSRMASTRLPGKPLLDICGKSMIQRVWESAKKSRIIERIIVATDDIHIKEKCIGFGAECVMTPSELPSGTDRIMKAYEILGENAAVVVNIQGDEPLLFGDIIDKMLEKFIHTDFDVGTMIAPVKKNEELFDFSIVKVELNNDMTAKRFSRNPIPELDNIPKEVWLNHQRYFKHIGIYAYKTDSLKKFVSLPVSDWEKQERLEQLRLLESGAKYFCHETNAYLIGVDTAEDLEKVREYFRE